MHNRPSAIKFWALDTSAGAGSLSSPVREEHFKNASEMIILGEKYGSLAASLMPRWLLLSVLGIVSRELTSRDVRERLVPALTESNEAQQKALSTANQLRRNLDERVSRVLKGVTTRRPGDTRSVIDRFIEQEMKDLENSITSVQDVLENEITGALSEVLQLELSDRFERSVSTAVNMNMTTSYDELMELLGAADKNSDGTLSMDELYELVFGVSIDPQLNDLAQQMVVLRNPDMTDSRLEKWTSLALAPWVARLGRASQLVRDAGFWLDQHGPKYGEALGKMIAKDYAPESLMFPQAYKRVLGEPPPPQLMRTLPGLASQQVLLPARDVATKTAALMKGTSKLATETVLEALEAVYERKQERKQERSDNSKSAAKQQHALNDDDVQDLLSTALQARDDHPGGTDRRQRKL